MSKTSNDEKRAITDPSTKGQVFHNYPHLIRALKQVDESEENEKKNAYNGIGDVTGNEFRFYGIHRDSKQEKGSKK